MLIEPKAQCKACLAYWDAGIVFCTCGHFLRDNTTENKKYIKSVLDLFSIPNFLRQRTRSTSSPFLISSLSRTFTSGRTDHTVTGTERKKVIKNITLRINSKRSVHDRFIRDTWFRNTMLELGRTAEVIREMDKLANEDHTHIATEEELNVYRSNWWSNTMPTRHRPDFKEELSTLRRLKNAEDQAYYQNWWQSSSSSWWQWQVSWWHPSSETSPRRWTDYTLIERGNLRKSVNRLFSCGMSLTTNLVQKLQRQNSVTANAVHCHRRGCEEHTSYHRKRATKTENMQQEEQHEH